MGHTIENLSQNKETSKRYIRKPPLIDNNSSRAIQHTNDINIYIPAAVLALLLSMTNYAKAETNSSIDGEQVEKTQVWVEYETNVGYRNIDHVVFDHKKLTVSLNGFPLELHSSDIFNSHLKALTKPISRNIKLCEAGRFTRAIQINSQPKEFVPHCLESNEYKIIYRELHSLSSHQSRS